MKRKTERIKKRITFLDKYSNLLEFLVYVVLLVAWVIFELPHSEISFGEYIKTKVLDVSFFTSFIAAFAIARIVSLSIKWIKKKNEDSLKLAIDAAGVENVIKTYINMVRQMPLKIFSDGKLDYTKPDEIIKYALPGVILGGPYNGNLYPLKLRDIDVIDTKECFTPPAYVSQHLEELSEAHSASLVYNNMNIRLDNLEVKNEGKANKKIVLHTSRTTYFNSLITNRAADYILSDGNSLRVNYEPGPFLFDLQNSKFSNHIGFNLFLHVKDKSGDDCFVTIFRGNKNSVSKNKLGPSVAASLKTKYALNEDGNFTTEGLIQGIKYELVDELNIKPEFISESPGPNNWINLKNDVWVVSIYRDLIEAGKPQIVLYAKSDIYFEDLEAQFNENAVQKANTENEKKMQKDGENVVKLPFNKVEYILDKDEFKLGENTYQMDPQTKTALAFAFNAYKNKLL